MNHRTVCLCAKNLYIKISFQNMFGEKILMKIVISNCQIDVIL